MVDPLLDESSSELDTEGEQEVPRTSGDLVLFIRVENEYGRPLSSEQWTAEAIEAMCVNNINAEYHAIPTAISMTSPTEAILEFPAGTTVVLAAVDLGKATYWFGENVKIDCMIATMECAQSIAHDRNVQRKRLQEFEVVTREEHLEQKGVLQEILTGFQEYKVKIETIGQDVKNLQQAQKAAVPPKSKGRTSVPTPKTGSNDCKSNNEAKDLGTPQTSLSTITVEASAVSRRLSPPQIIKGKMPAFDLFSGDDPTPKHELNFDAWLYQVRGSEGLYSPYMLRQGIVKSLRGHAARQARYQGPKATPEQILIKLVKNYGQKASDEVMITEFHNISMVKGEKVKDYVDRMEGVMEQIRLKYPSKHTEAEEQTMFRTKFYHGATEKVRFLLMHSFRDENKSYDDLVTIAREMETEGTRREGVTVASKAAALAEPEEGSEDEFTQMKTQLAQLMSAAAAPQGKPKGKNGDRQAKNSGSGTDPKKEWKPKDPESKDWERKVRCFKCGGWGHYARDCASRLNSGGEAKKGPNAPPQETAPIPQAQNPLPPWAPQALSQPPPWIPQAQNPRNQ